MTSTRKKIVAGGIAALAVAGGGAAIAATQLGTPAERSAAIVTDAAQQLGVAPSALSDALKSAEKKQVDQAVAAGQLTQAQGDALKNAIDSGQVPLVNVGPRGGLGFGDDHGGFGFGHHGFFGGPGAIAGGLDAAATYLGVTTTQLQTDLQNGQTLADVAKAQGKTVDGLVTALVASASSKLDAAVKAGTLTQSQADSIKTDLTQHVTDLVNGTRPAGPDGDGDHGFGWQQYGGPDGPSGGAGGTFGGGGSATFGGQPA
jgi:hypothetical protein